MGAAAAMVLDGVAVFVALAVAGGDDVELALDEDE
jgi:hypothetical protein